MEKLVFFLDFIYLFVYYFFISYLSVRLLFNYFKGAIMWFSAVGSEEGQFLCFGELALA